MFTRAKYEVSDVLDPMDGFVPGYSTHTSLRSVPDCGDPDCIGHCDQCIEYKEYGDRMDEARRNCKVQQAYELGARSEGWGEYFNGEPTSVYCDCQICTALAEIVIDDE